MQFAFSVHFCCSELLVHLQGELDEWPNNVRLASPSRQVAIPHDVLPSLFQGRITSKVRSAAHLAVCIYSVLQPCCQSMRKEMLPDINQSTRTFVLVNPVYYINQPQPECFSKLSCNPVTALSPSSLIVPYLMLGISVKNQNMSVVALFPGLPVNVEKHRKAWE